MYFKRLEIHGFKSFADPVVIEFTDGITCIVGPNGSGKSNISDAVRWVLGEQSPKQLRGGKMEEVIFNGSETRRPRGMAEVTLVIDNTAHILDIDYAEVAVTRRMYRSGESEYLINGNHCRLRDIRELFLDTGIGVEGYSIIGQGRIADIISGRPESRREIFEESAGVSAYRVKREESERKLEQTQQNVDRISDIVAELEGRRKTLKSESEKAKEYLALRDEYRTLEVNLTLRNIHNAKERLDKYAGDLDGLAKQLDEADAKRNALEADSVRSDERIRFLEEQLEEARRGQPALIEAITNRQKETEYNAERIARIAEDLELAAEEQRGIVEKLKQADAELDRLNEEKTAAVTSLREAERRLARLEEENARLAEADSGADQIVSDGNDRLFRLHSEAASKKAEAKSYENYRSTLDARRKTLEAERSSAKTEQEALREKHQACSEELDRLDRERKNAGETSERLAVDIEQRSRRSEETRKELDEKRIRHSQTETRLRTIAEMEQNYEGYSAAVRFIMNAGLDGIEGTCAERIDVPQGYETAVETALGAAKQNIITADDRAAKEAVRALKVNHAGRLTFLPVETIRGRVTDPDPAVKNAPGYLGMAADLVTCDDRYRAIFDHLLGRTAVAKDLDSAIRMSKKNRSGLRFVTVDGEVVAASGAITGGQYRNRTSGLLDRKNEKTRLSDALDTLKREIAKLEETQQEDAEQLEKRNTELRASEEAVRDLELRQRELTPEAEALARQIETTEERIVRIDRELEANEKERARSDALSQGLLADSAAAEEEIRKVSADIESALADSEEKKKAFDAHRAKLTECRLRTGEQKNLVSGIESRLAAQRTLRADLESRRARSVERTEALNNERETIRAGSANQAPVTELEAKRDALEKQIAELDRKRSEERRSADELRKTIRTLDTGRESVRDQKYRIELRVSQSESQLENLKQKLWNEFELSTAQAMDLWQDDFPVGQSAQRSRDLRDRIRSLGDVNVSAIREFDEVEERYRFLTDQLSDVLEAESQLKQIISDLDRKITTRFRDNFEAVETNFERIFAELFGGGHAELRLDQEDDPLHSGIEIIAQPPGKKLQNINLLSGGEKTVSAIALMFAVLVVQPTPFCILDEVEAALDEENIARFADYLRNFKTTQFALITHQKATMAHADTLYGITMAEEGVSKVLSLRLGDPDADRFTEQGS